ncbi:DNA polymerase III subunit tau [wastewater metagenome]|uniref:DNA-directed DNA polymerase n=2 Tax=unclassified sequences TaxID=12908 RepID=A0A5B8R859_9ZZZZ|nr:MULTISPECIES: DNA polymerase III subunit gamma/tau [Arhodomonas]MCS4503712.1 DNA polymerase III subunit gamma/tau [Arhodomonas aquaeolei]QEA04661.1 DNA polymerase III subunit tau [uncultured organism]
MAYQVLARKWRPRTFAELVGQTPVRRALANAIANDRLHHAYLFTGTRGVGKTTIARIFAKCLNCEREGVTTEPCGECEACREIDEGRFVDLIEVDAASRTGVDDTRELLDNVQYTPTRGRYKIYLVDEVHMFSRHSFNALLKTLEEPPPHVKFLLATTDPQKLPVTILSRCLQFNLKHLPASLIAEHLNDILEREGIGAESGAVMRLARAADGSMRDGLSLLDQALGYGGGQVTDDDVRAMLGSLDSEFVLSLLEAVADEDAGAVMGVIAEMAERAPDFAEGINEVLAALHRLSVIQLAPDALGSEAPEDERLHRLAERLSPEDVQLFYQIALHGRRDLPWAPEARTGFEMAMLRMLAFRPADVPAGEAGQGGGRPASPPAAKPRNDPHRAAGPATAPRAGATGRTGLPSVAGGPAGAAAVQAGAPAGGRPEPVAAAEATSGSMPAESPAPAVAPEPPVAKSPAPEPAPPGPAAQAEPAPGADGVDWNAVVAGLRVGGMVRALAQHCRWGGREGDCIRLYIEEGHQHLNNESMRTRLARVLGEYFGESLRLEIRQGSAEGETPAEGAQRARQAREAAARESIETDPNVTAIREAFDGEVVTESVRPLDREQE